MRRGLVFRLVVLALAGAGAGAGPAAAQGPGPGLSPAPCRPLTHEGANYTVCTVDLRRNELRLFWQAPGGEPYASLGTLARSPEGSRLVMATNAGMYDRDLAPVGLYVEGGRQLKPANRASGFGNFHLKPNGIFYVADGKAAVAETGAYLRRRPKVALATQSGPMLVIDGKLHPKFSDEGPSRKIRNGVGVADPQTVVFAISDEPVSFGAFARLFRDELACRDALFLDGSISGLHAPNLGRTDIALKPLGPMIGALPRDAGESRVR